MDMLTQGYTKHVEELNDLVNSLDVQTEGVTISPGVSGFSPIVPNYISGHPFTMRRRVSADSETAPIRVFVAMAVSCGVTAEQARLRGAAIIGLCLALANFRPVELWLYSSGDSKKNCQLIRLGNSPWDLSEIGFMVGHTAAMRLFVYGLEAKNGWSGRWADYSYCGNLDLAKLREHIDITEHDIIIPGQYLGDNNDDVEAWIKDKIEQWMSNRHSGEPMVARQTNKAKR